MLRRFVYMISLACLALWSIGCTRATRTVTTHAQGAPGTAVHPDRNGETLPAWEADQHASIMVNGEPVYYYYDADGSAVFYKLNAAGNPDYLDDNWRPWYLQNGTRVSYLPTPYFFVGGDIVYYYWNGSGYRYYTYNGSALNYYPVSWRPYIVNNGVRSFYRPRVRYRYRRWRRHRRHIRYRRWRRRRAMRRLRRRRIRRRYRRRRGRRYRRRGRRYKRRRRGRRGKRSRRGRRGKRGRRRR